MAFIGTRKLKKAVVVIGVLVEIINAVVNLEHFPTRWRSAAHYHDVKSGQIPESSTWLASDKSLYKPVQSHGKYRDFARYRDEVMDMDLEEQCGFRVSVSLYQLLDLIRDNPSQ